MNQMIEKLARAAQAQETGLPVGPGNLDPEYVPLVIALLTALREPSEEMVWATQHNPMGLLLPEVRAAIFTAMIDSILPKGGEG